MSCVPVAVEEDIEFTDWLGEQRSGCRALRPQCREALVEWMERQGDLTGLRMRAVGAGHSTSGVARPFDAASIAVIVDDLVIPDDEASEAEGWVAGAALLPGEHLIRIPAGMTIAQLNAALLRLRWALPNMGSYDAQTIAGAISTGTHGTGLVTGPLPDFVVSIEIVAVLQGPRVTALRVEPADGPTDPASFTGARFGLELIKDTAAFESCVVGLGAFGIVTAVTLKVVDRFWLREQCWVTSWRELGAGRTLLDLVEREPFVDVVMTPLPWPHHEPRNHRCLVTVRRPAPETVVSPPRNDARRRALEERLADHLHEEDPHRALTLGLASLASQHPIVANHMLLDNLEREAEENAARALHSLSQTVLRTSVGDLVMATSAEVAVPLEHAVEAIDLLIDHLAELHDRGYHHGSAIGIRFGAASRHFLAMHHGQRTCTIETPILLGMRAEGHDDAESDADISDMLNAFTSRFLRDPRFAARVHWGQRHAISREQVAARYPGFSTWETQMRRFNPYGIFDNRLTLSIAPADASAARRTRAWLWADRPASSDYPPDLGFQHNSAGRRNRIRRLGEGQYQVELPGLGVRAGVVHAVAYGGNHHCNVEGWARVGGSVRVWVNCFDPGGRLADGCFVLLFYKESRVQPAGRAYLWANRPSAANYTPSSRYQWNSAGGTNTVARLGAGRYRVTLPGITTPGGVVLVTGYGSGPERCKVGGWRRLGNDLLVDVNCFDVAGNPADARSTLSFLKDVSVGSRFPEEGRHGGYVWANEAGSSSYTPSATFQMNTAGGPNTLVRSAPGVYRVRFPGLEFRESSAALAVAYGSGSEYCSVQGWISDDAGGTNVTVHCFTSLGVPTDAQFTLLYLTDDRVGS